MIRFCDIHGPVALPDGPSNQFFKCPNLITGGKPCNTVLKERPGGVATTTSATLQTHSSSESSRRTDPGGIGDAEPLTPPYYLKPGERIIPPLSPQEATLHTRAKQHNTTMKQGAFLAAYGQLGNITAASKAADIDRKRHYEWLENDPEYVTAFDETHALAVQTLVDAAYNRAMGLAGEASDRLMIKFLESIPPSKQPRGWMFNPIKRHEISGPGGGPIETNENARDALSSRIASLTTPTDTPTGD